MAADGGVYLQYFAKGRMIGLVGSIQTRDWTDNEGRKRYATEVIVDEAYFTESKGSSEGGTGAQRAAVAAERPAATDAASAAGL